MSKPRCELTAHEVAQLHQDLQQRLASVGIATQPAVASRIVELVSRPDSQVVEYARLIKTDPALSGRMLRLVNSAYFAQRQPVTALDRACTLLGIERLKSFAIGFYLSRGASTDPNEDYGRRVWGESLMRACLAAELARRVYPLLVSEAFIVGLMMDASLPLMARLCGPDFTALVASESDPVRCHALEIKHLPFTHTDVIKALALRWKLPDILTRPLEWHHTAPAGDGPRAGAVQRLHAIAYYVGSVRFNSAGTPLEAAPLPSVAGRLMGMDSAALAASVKRAVAEYQGALELFREIATGMTSLDELAVRVHEQLCSVVEDAITSGISAQAANAPRRFRVGGFGVEVGRSEQGQGLACVVDAGGSALLSQRFLIRGTTPEHVLHLVGVTPEAGDEFEDFAKFVRGLAA